MNDFERGRRLSISASWWVQFLAWGSSSGSTLCMKTRSTTRRKLHVKNHISRGLKEEPDEVEARDVVWLVGNGTENLQSPREDRPFVWTLLRVKNGCALPVYLLLSTVIRLLTPAKSAIISAPNCLPPSPSSKHEARPTHYSRERDRNVLFYFRGVRLEIIWNHLRIERQGDETKGLTGDACGRAQNGLGSLGVLINHQALNLSDNVDRRAIICNAFGQSSKHRTSADSRGKVPNRLRRFNAIQRNESRAKTPPCETQITEPGYAA